MKNNFKDFPDQALSHFVRCRHPMANYVQDMSNLRESVQIPFERPTSNITRYLLLSLSINKSYILINVLKSWLK